MAHHRRMRFGFVLMLVVAASPAYAQPAAQGFASETLEALRLRSRAGLDAPSGSHMIIVHSVASHHLTDEFAQVAVRGHDGVWTVSVVGEERPGLVGTETIQIPEVRRTLTARQGRELDRLLGQADLFATAPLHNPAEEIGTSFHTMEILTRERRTVIRWTGRLRDTAGRVADLIMGRGRAD